MMFSPTFDWTKTTVAPGAGSIVTGAVTMPVQVRLKKLLIV